MSNVTLSIGGRSFTVACADGEEAHVTGLGRLIDAKAAEAGAVGQTESRMLLFASLMLADTVHDLQRRAAETAAQAVASAAASAAAPASGPSISPELTEILAETLDAVASRIENLVTVLESEATSA